MFASVFQLTTAGLLVSLVVSLLNVYNHLTHFHEPRFQLYVVRIILIVPVIPETTNLLPGRTNLFSRYTQYKHTSAS